MSATWFGYRSGPTFGRACTESITVCKGYQQTTNLLLARKELMKFWSFSHISKVVLLTCMSSYLVGLDDYFLSALYIHTLCM